MKHKNKCFTHDSATISVKFVNAKTKTAYKKIVKLTVNVEANKEEEPVVETKFEAKQVGAKKIALTSPVVISEASKGAIKVTRGSSTVDVTVDLKDGKNIELTAAKDLINAEYTVAFETSKATFTGEEEIVEEIKFTSADNKAVLDAKKSGENVYLRAKTGYQVLNQWGENITADSDRKLTSIQSSTSNVADDNKGTLTFTTNQSIGFMLGDIITVVAVYQNGTNIKNATATLTVSNEAVIDSIEFLPDVYDKDGKVATLTEDTDFSKKYYVAATVKDQYGSDITAFNDNNALIFVNGGITGVSGTGSTLKIAGKEYAAVELSAGTKKAGTFTVIAVSRGTGKQFTSPEYTMDHGSKVDTLTIEFPADVIGGQQNKLAFEALDTNGKPVKAADKLADLNGIANGGSYNSNGGLRVVKDLTTGEGTLYYDAPNNDTTQRIQYPLIVTTATNKVLQFTATVSPNAKIASVALDAKVVKAGIAGQTSTIKASDIIVKDQYDQKVTWVGAGSGIGTGVTVVITSSTKTSIEFAATSAVGCVTTDVTVNTTTKTQSAINGTSTALNTSAFDVNYQATAGKTTLTIEVFKSGTTDAVAKTTVDFTTIKAAETYDSFKVTAIDNVFCGTNAAILNDSLTYSSYDKEIKVYGVKDGVEVPFYDYTVTALDDSPLTLTQANKTSATFAKVGAADLSATALKTDAEKTYKVRVAINDASGKSYDVEYKATKDSVKAKTVEFATATDTHYVLSSSGSADVDFDWTNIQAVIKVKDQYGVEIQSYASLAPLVKFSDVKLVAKPSGVNRNATWTVEVANNGSKGTATDAPTLTFKNGSVALDEALVTLDFGNGVTFVKKLILS